MTESPPLNERMARVETRVTSIENSINANHRQTDDRLRVVERIVFIGVGIVCLINVITPMIFWNLMK